MNKKETLLDCVKQLDDFSEQLKMCEDQSQIDDGYELKDMILIIEDIVKRNLL